MTVDDVVTICSSVIIGLGGGSIIIWRLSNWLGKVWANRILAEDKLKYTQQLEIVKNELGRASQEYLIKFSSLHAERATIIRDLHAKLVDAQRVMNSTLKPFQEVGEPSLDDKIDTFVKSINNFNQFYLNNRIYLPRQLCTQIETFAVKLREMHIDITTYPVDPKDIECQVVPGLAKERREMWEQARSEFDNEAKSLGNNIETEFRKLLGVER